MYPFIHLPEYRVTVCKECGVAVIVDEVASHLDLDKHRSLLRVWKRQVMESLSHIPGIIKSSQELEGFQFPPPTTKAIPGLSKPSNNGMRCMECTFITPRRQEIQGHCQAEHGWKDGRKRSRDVYEGAHGEDVPWISGVPCQRFFRRGLRSEFFEIQQGNKDKGEAQPDVSSSLLTASTNGLKQMEKINQEQTMELDESKDVDQWLEYTGWAIHLSGLDRVKLLGYLQPPDSVKDAILYGVCESFDRIIDVARATAVPGLVGRAILFEINREERGVKATSPLNGHTDLKVLSQGREVWKQLLCYLFRSQTNYEHGERPRYQLSDLQFQLLDKFTNDVDCFQKQRGDDQGEGRKGMARIPTREQVDCVCLRLCIGLLDHQLGDNEYDSVLISGLAVIGLRDEGGWLTAADSVSIYSSFIKIARMVVLQDSYMERQARSKMFDWEDGTPEGLFNIVQQKVQRFMTLVSEQSQPTPMDWVYESRSYGQKMAEAAIGKVI
jgi:hypothetical protein